MSIRRRILLLLTLALAFPGITGRAQAPQTAPAKAAPVVQAVQSPSERQFRAWLSAFNTGDRAAYEAFLREQFPSRTARLDGDMDFRLRTGGFDLRKVEGATATAVTCLVQERAWEQVARAVVEVEAAPPHRIVQLGLNLVPRPADLAVRRLSEADLASAVRTKVDAQAAGGRFQGAVLVARDGKVVYSEAKGLADRETGTPNTPGDAFPHGLDEQDVHRDGRPAARAGRQGEARRASRNLPDGLSQPRCRHEGDHPSPADPHRRHRRHLRAGVQRAPPGAEDARRLRDALRRARPRVRARVEMESTAITASCCWA